MPELVWTDAELGLQPGWDEKLDPNIRRELREARILKRENAELAERLSGLERRDAYRRAGIPDDKRGDAFAAIAKSDPNDTAALKAEFEELFGVTSGDAGAGQQLTEEELEAQRRIAEAGGTQTGTPGQVEFEAALRDPTKSREEIIALIKEHGHLAGIRMAGEQQI